MSDSVWSTKTIRELGAGNSSTVQTGPFGSQLHAEDYVEEGVPFILIRNIGDGGLKADNLPRISVSDAKRLAKYSLNSGDIVFTRVGRAGSCLLVTDKESGWIISGQTLRLRLDNPELDSRFFLYALRSHTVQKFVSNSSVGTTRESLNTKILQSIPVLHPGYIEQKRIAEILSTVDEAIEQTEALIAKYQQIKAGLMQDLFTRGLSPEASAKGDVTWTLRPTSAQAPHLYKESPLGLIPKAWSFGLLSDFLQGGPKNGYSPQEVSEWSGLYALGLGCLTGEGFKPNQLKVVGLGGLQCHQALLQDGDFLLSRSNTRELVGLCGIYRDVGSPCIYPDLMMRIRPNGRTSAEFLEALLLSPLMRVRITSAAVGTSGSMVKLNSRAVLRLQLAMPEKDEQTHILKFIHTQRETLMSFEYDLAKLRQQKQGLMQDLLTGRVRVKVGEAEEKL